MWKLIATAPQDERILVFDQEWCDTMGAVQIGWLDGERCHVEGLEGFQPSHWIPLPDTSSIEEST